MVVISPEVTYRSVSRCAQVLYAVSSWCRRKKASSYLRSLYQGVEVESLIMQSVCIIRAEAKMGSYGLTEACLMAAQVENARMYEPIVGKCFASFPMSEGGRVWVRIPFGEIVRSVLSKTDALSSIGIRRCNLSTGSFDSLIWSRRVCSTCGQSDWQGSGVGGRRSLPFAVGGMNSRWGAGCGVGLLKDW